MIPYCSQKSNFTAILNRSLMARLNCVKRPRGERLFLFRARSALDFVEVGKVLRMTSGPFGSDGITLRKKMYWDPTCRIGGATEPCIFK